MSYLLFDGHAVKVLDWRTLFGAAMEGTISSKAKLPELAHSVPWLSRCIQIRADAVASMPFEILRGETSVAWPLQDRIEALLYRTEAALITYGQAYWLKDKGGPGGRVLRDLRYIAPGTITPKYDRARGLVGFERSVDNRKITLEVDDLIYFWTPNESAEVGPGKPLAMSALLASKSAKSTLEFLDSFFTRGAIPATILSVEGNPGKTELKRLEAWWKRLLRGLQSAWEAVAVRASVKPQTVGYPLSELDIGPIMEEMRREIAVSLGVPQTLLEDASNYATAKEHRKSLYDETIVPECERIANVINEQLLGPLGLRLRFKPEELEIYQQDEAQKAQAIVNLVNAGIMDLPEAREQMNLEPRESEVRAEAGQQTEKVRSDVSLELRRELRRWRDKAKRRGKVVEFKSEIIPGALGGLIESALKELGPEDAWAFLKAPEPARDEAERALLRAVQDVLGKQVALFLRAVMNKASDAELERLASGLSAELKAALAPVLAKIVFEQALRIALEVGVDFDTAVINEAALAWAREYSGTMVKGVTETTLKMVRKAIAQFVETPGMTEGDVEKLLEPAFGKARAQMISVTETTRAYSNATNHYRAMFEDELGLHMTRVWRTRHDELVCPICGPLNDQPEAVWVDRFPDGPPAHVNCRCWTVLRLEE